MPAHLEAHRRPFFPSWQAKEAQHQADARRMAQHYQVRRTAELTLLDNSMTRLPGTLPKQPCDKPCDRPPGPPAPVHLWHVRLTGL